MTHICAVHLGLVLGIGMVLNTSPTAAQGLQKITISGQSSGGSMAMQHLFAFSKQVEGLAVAAGSPYGCGAFPEGKYIRKGNWTGTCYYGGTNLSKTAAYIEDRIRQGLIDDPTNLKNTPIIVFNGKWDWTVYSDVGKDIVEQLSSYVEADKVVSKLNTFASHVWSIDHWANGTATGTTGLSNVCWCGRCGLYLFDSYDSPCCDVNNCGYDLSGDLLRRAYNNVKPRTKALEVFSWLKQEKYMPPKTKTWKYAALEKWAVVYIPSGCKGNTARCRVHVNYHGCIANKWSRRKMWVSNLDLNEYGEANDIIILYPQAKGDKTTGHGCWNWGFKHDDKLFDTKYGVQLATVNNMVAGLQSNTITDMIELPLKNGPPAQGEDPEDYGDSAVSFV